MLVRLRERRQGTLACVSSNSLPCSATLIYSTFKSPPVNNRTTGDLPDPPYHTDRYISNAKQATRTVRPYFMLVMVFSPHCEPTHFTVDLCHFRFSLPSREMFFSIQARHAITKTYVGTTSKNSHVEILDPRLNNASRIGRSPRPRQSGSATAVSSSHRNPDSECGPSGTELSKAASVILSSCCNVVESIPRTTVSASWG